MSNPETDYAVCITCEMPLPIKTDADTHISKTASENGGHSHRIRILNPTPDQIAARRVETLIEDAVDYLIDKVQDEIDRGRLTTEQATEVIYDYSDFTDAWNDHLQESE